jgi:DNA-binding CsgD family transcriptional regulator
MAAGQGRRDLSTSVAAALPHDRDPPAGAGRADVPGRVRALLLELARGHGFDGAVYMHLGHGLGALKDPAVPVTPHRLAGTPAFDEAQYLRRNYLAFDSLAALACERCEPFVWRLADLEDERPESRRFVAILAGWGMRSGVIAPVHDYRQGPALLNLFTAEPAAAMGELDLGRLLLAALRVHAVAKELLGAPGSGEALLTPREMAVLRLAALGCTEQEAAMDLGLSRRGVQFHTARACEKLAAPNKIAAVARAIGAGLIRL